MQGGLRATQMLKQVVTKLSMMPLTEQVTIPFFPKFINEKSVFVPDETIEKAVHIMFTELARWSDVMKQRRRVSRYDESNWN